MRAILKLILIIAIKYLLIRLKSERKTKDKLQKPSTDEQHLQEIKRHLENLTESNRNRKQQLEDTLTALVTGILGFIFFLLLIGIFVGLYR